MNKTELVMAMAEKAGLTKKDAEKALVAFTDVVAERRVTRLLSLDSVLSRQDSVLHAQARTPRQAQRLRFPQQQFPLSRQARLLKTS